MSKTEKWAVILNPTAGNGFAGKNADYFKSRFKEYGVDAEWAITSKKGDGSILSERFAKDGFTHIIGIGGDGTMNEIAAPLVGNKDITLGLIAAGTGNDFIQILGFPGRFKDEDWNAFFRGETRRMDVGYCNNRPFLNGMGLGFDAQVAAANYHEGGEVKKGGKDKYLWHILTTLMFFREKKVVMNTGNGDFGSDCFMNTVSIGRRFAGGFYLTPKAIADDGLLDVCNIKRLSIPRRLKILTMVPKGTHLKDRRVNYYQTDNIRIEFPGKVPFHVDGELFFDQIFNISLKQKAVNFIYNSDGQHFFQRR